ncbi:hypothetical protein HMPREF9080_01484, partial [Cardiobacterium valvarum F0432]
QPAGQARPAFCILGRNAAKRDNHAAYRLHHKIPLQTHTRTYP